MLPPQELFFVEVWEIQNLVSPRNINHPSNILLSGTQNRILCLNLLTDTGLGVPRPLSFSSTALASKDSLFPAEVIFIPLISVSSCEHSL